MKSIDNKIVIATGGTGGHIFPAVGLKENLEQKGFLVSLTTDTRGLKFLSKFDYSKLKVIKSVPFNTNIFISLLKNILAIANSLTFLLKKKPKFVFGMGGYASFSVCCAAIILRIPVVIYENNLHIGKSNRYLLPFVKKLFLAYSETEGINLNYKNKVFTIGNILRKEILDFSKNKTINNNEKLNILILGGSQAAKIFAEKLPEIFVKCKNIGLNFKIFQQCLPYQNQNLENFYKKNQIEYELFNFSFNMLKFYKLTNLLISRAGSSALSESLNCSIPIISVPLRTAADNHQFKNAKYFEKKGFGIILKEENIDDELFQLLHSMHKDKSILDNMIQKQQTHNDKFVFKKLDKEIEKLFYEN